MNDLARPRFV